MKKLSVIIVLTGLSATSYAMQTTKDSSGKPPVTDSAGAAVNIENAKEGLLKYAEERLLDLAHKSPGLFLVVLDNSTYRKVFLAETWKSSPALTWKSSPALALAEISYKSIFSKLDKLGITYQLDPETNCFGVHVRPLFDQVIPNVLAALAREAAVRHSFAGACDSSKTASVDRLLLDFDDRYSAKR